jgi:hypothetical protein
MSSLSTFRTRGKPGGDLVQPGGGGREDLPGLLRGALGGAREDGFPDLLRELVVWLGCPVWHTRRL